MKARLLRRALCAMSILPLAIRLAGAPGEPVTLLRTPNDGIQPQAVVDKQGTIHLIYFKGAADGGDVFYVREPAGGHSFSEPIRVNSKPASAIAMGTIRGAQIAMGRNGWVHVAWNGHRPKNGSYLEAPMLYARLSEGSPAFEPERNLITSARGLDGGGTVAADAGGNVYVLWHAPIPGDLKDEADRAVFVARSSDDGKIFTPETRAILNPTGACGCCGMKAFADGEGNLFAFYRAAWESTNRDETLLISRDHGMNFEILYKHGWNMASCPMSSFFISESSAGVLAAAETHHRVHFVLVNPKTGKVSEPVCPENNAKYPIAIANAEGRVLLAWAEGTSWGKGGSIAWQIFDQKGDAISAQGHADGLPAWSLLAAVAKPDGNFAIIY